jgi:hypothetical protein
MSWFRLLLPLILLSACGGSVDTPDGPREPVIHRVTEVTCGARPADAGDVIPSPPTYGECETAAQCTSGLNGRCVVDRGGFSCDYDLCFEDDDCGSGSVCRCGNPGGEGNRCTQAGCRVDADCPGSWCSPTFGTCGNYSGVVGYACHTQKDECVDDADCAGSGGYCWYSPMVAHWLCSTANCVG